MPTWAWRGWRASWTRGDGARHRRSSLPSSPPCRAPRPSTPLSTSGRSPAVAPAPCAHTPQRLPRWTRRRTHRWACGRSRNSSTSSFTSAPWHLGSGRPQLRQVCKQPREEVTNSLPLTHPCFPVCHTRILPTYTTAFFVFGAGPASQLEKEKKKEDKSTVGTESLIGMAFVDTILGESTLTTLAVHQNARRRGIAEVWGGGAT